MDARLGDRAKTALRKRYYTNLVEMLSVPGSNASVASSRSEGLGLAASSTENHIDTAHYLGEVPGGQLSDALGKKVSVHSDDLRRICDRIFREARHFGR